MSKLEGKYNPKEFEERLYKEWEEKGYFKPSMDAKKEPYCIMMPPPNVTGKLHMGHALDDTIQDILIRFKRMQGFDCLWLPGSDHAAISTEMKVVQKLKSEGKTKQELGRDGFLKEAWDWTHEYGGIIQEQQRKLGCSCDWSRNRFTLDDGMSEAVLEQFVRLYNKGLIYKGTRMVNYCPSCLPIMNREIPIIADEFVEKEFGTGCVKITPFGTQKEKMLKIKRLQELKTNYSNDYREEKVAC